MKKNHKIIIEYDGSGFSGWQRQNDRPTVQGILEKTLSVIFNTDVTISGSGRTDAGVHAWGQVANFIADDKIEPEKIKNALNSMIKVPVIIRECRYVPDDFHAQYSAVSKEYNYIILNRNDPCAIERQFKWHIRPPLDINRMNECCRMICGIHDFKSFENTGSPRSSTIRQILFAEFEPEPEDHIKFKICATGFLKYMVRNIVGTLIDVGLYKTGIKEFSSILEAKDRKKAGATAPAHGLFLKRVNYS